MTDSKIARPTTSETKAMQCMFIDLLEDDFDATWRGMDYFIAIHFDNKPYTAYICVNPDAETWRVEFEDISGFTLLPVEKYVLSDTGTISVGEYARFKEPIEGDMLDGLTASETMKCLALVEERNP